MSLVTAPESLDSLDVGGDSIMRRTLSSPPLRASSPHNRWWRAAEIPAANGHGNARSVATIQQIIANNGHALGHRFFSETTGNKVFQSQVQSVDLVLQMDLSLGLGYGLASVPCRSALALATGRFFGGFVIIMDQDLGLTVAYMMNKMQVGLVGDARGPAFALTAALAAMS